MPEERQYTEEAREVLHSFRQVNRALKHLMRVQASQLGLTPVQLMVVRILADSPNLSLSELAEKVQLGCSTVSGVVTRLVECGVVERDRLDEDQRTVSIRLTEKGKELENRAYGDNSLVSQAVKSFLQLPKQDIQKLLSLHQKLIHLLSVEQANII